MPGRGEDGSLIDLCLMLGMWHFTKESALRLDRGIDQVLLDLLSVVLAN